MKKSFFKVSKHMSTTVQEARQPLEMQANNSVSFEEQQKIQNQKMVIKRDGVTKEPFSAEQLKADLESHLHGLNKDFLTLDIIVEKVQKGIYNGKYTQIQTNTHISI